MSLVLSPIFIQIVIPQIKKTGEYSCEIAHGVTSELLNKPTLNACLPPTVATGASKTAVITLLTGTMTKTAAGYAPAMGWKT